MDNNSAGVEVCRICLALDCKLFLMTAYHQLQEAYESFTGIQLDEDSLPQYVCFECAQRLSNSLQFRDKCIKTHMLLTELATGMVDGITLPSLQSINRELHNLNSTLSWTTIFGFDTSSYTIVETSYDVEVKDDSLDNEEYIQESKEARHPNTEDDPDDQKGAKSDKYNIKIEKSQPLDNINCNSDGTPVTYKSDNSEKEDCDLKQRNKILMKNGKTYNCNECNKNFLLLANLKFHQLSHERAKFEKHICKLCNCECKNRAALLRHIRTHREKYICNVCGRTFQTHPLLRIHMRCHTGIRQHACNVCGKKYQQRDLKRHLQTHLGEKPYTCKVCDKKFAALHHVNRHMKLHSGVKPHACDMCEKKYVERGNLLMHMRTHTGEKPFSCDICSQKFTYNVELNKHLVKIHNSKKQFSCDVCLETFYQQSSLGRHKRLRHSLLVH